MKNSKWLGASALIAVVLSLSGCGASDGEQKKNSGGEGTNTGNGSCLPPWCEYAFPHVLTTDDGQTFAGVLNIDASESLLNFTGDAVIGTEGNCELSSGWVQQFGVPLRQFSVPLSLLSIDSDRTMRFSAAAWAYAEADLTLTNELYLSGTTTLHFTASGGVAVELGGPNPDLNATTWTTTFTVHGKASVGCDPGQSSASIPFKQGSSSAQLACRIQPSPPGYTGCNDQAGPTE